MHIDVSSCTGCEACVEGCKKENNLGKDVPRRWKLRIDDLSSTRYTTIERRPGDRFVRKFCRHCVDPACVSACLVGALTRTPDGAVDGADLSYYVESWLGGDDSVADINTSQVNLADNQLHLEDILERIEGHRQGRSFYNPVAELL